MNIFDISIILVLLMFGIIGFKKGVIKEIVSLLGMIIVLVIAFTLKGYVGNILCKYLPFYNFAGNIKGMVSLNILFYQVIGFFIVYSVLFSIYMIILKISGILQKLVDMTIILLLPSKILGFVVSAIEGYIIIFVILLVLYIPLNSNEYFTNSKYVNKIMYETPILSNNTKTINNTVEEIYNLGEDVNNKEIDINTANLKTIDLMLKNKIVNKKTIEQLIVLDKLKEVKNIDKVLNNY